MTTLERDSWIEQRDAWNKELQEKSPSEIIGWALKNFSPQLQSDNLVVQTTAFGATGMVIRDMIHNIQTAAGSDEKAIVSLVFIDTLYHFEETLELVKAVQSRYSAPLRVFQPANCSSVEEFEAKHGSKLWDRDGDKYDYLVKAEPGHRAYVELGVRAAFTGRRRTQGADRANLTVVELDFSLSPPLVKINPLASWDYDQVWKYIKDHNVLYNSLHDRGYKSIGDYHSTLPSKEGEGERDGRWSGQAKTECGLHKDYFKLKRSAAASSSNSAFTTTVNGAYSIHGVWKALALLSSPSATLQSIQSVEYSAATGIHLTITSSVALSPPHITPMEKDIQSSLSKYVVTIISSTAITFQNLVGILNLFRNVILVKTLSHSQSGVNVLEIQVGLEQGEFESKSSDLFKLSQVEKVDLNLQVESVYRKQKRLVIFDMDSTLIQQEVIDELAREAGVYDRISSITESAMRGEIDFDESLRQRVGLLTGTPSNVIEIVKARIQFTPGAFELCRSLKRLGFKLAVLSGGFMPLAIHVKTYLGLDYAFANNLEISSDGKLLTGKLVGTIVNGQKKADFLRVISQLEHIPKEQIVAVGDGANDLLMMAEASLGVAFNAKPKVQQLASARINQSSLLNVLYLLGYSADEIAEIN